MMEYKRQHDLILLEAGGGEDMVLSRLADAVGILRLDQDPSCSEWEDALLTLRTLGMGSRVTAEVVCPACQEKSEVSFDLSDLPRGPAAAPGDLDGVPLRLLRRSDLLAVDASGPGQNRIIELLSRAADRDQGWATEILDGPQAASAVAALERAVAGLDLKLQTKCPDCESAVLAPFDVAAFVHAEFKTRAQQVLRDVHTIASKYHWTEAEILALPQERRDAYLRMIAADAFQPEWQDGV